MKILKLDSNNEAEIIKTVGSVLQKGGLAVLPTDTVYGLGVDASNQRAVQKAIEFKSRTPGKAISVFVADLKMAENYVDIDKTTKKTLGKLFPGPYTVILPSKHRLDSKLEAENDTLGIRVPKYKFIDKLVTLFGRPITATSANLAGRSPHHSISSLLNALPKAKQAMIDIIVDAGLLGRNKPSTVVDFSQGDIKVLRQGDFLVNTWGLRQTFISKSESDTKELAGTLLSENRSEIKSKPLAFLLRGNLGAGKTIFVKGIGEALGINNIISPTFVIYYEYSILKKGVNNLYHFDLYKLQEKSEFEHLGLADVIKPGNIICVEWSEKGGAIKQLLENSKIIEVEMKYLGSKKREIIVNY